MIIGISGVLVTPSGRRVGMAGSGKDTVADFLLRRDFVKVSLADPLKRICRDVFDFSEEQLWGPSAERNKEDFRYPRRGVHEEIALEIDEQVLGPAFDIGPPFLTPRHALQQLGTEWGRSCYPNIWVEYTMRVAKKLSEEGGYDYNRLHGLNHWWRPGKEAEKTDVAIPDVRFKNEIVGIRKDGGKVVRVLRPLESERDTVDPHPSEQEALDIPDSEFDFVVPNTGDLHHLKLQTERMHDFLSGRIREYDPTQEDVPPFKRS